LSGAAVGGTQDVMGIIERGEYDQVGTFNGNPMMVAAARVALTEILTDDAYEHLDRLRRQMAEGCEDAIRKHGLAAHVVSIGAKGCVTFSPTPVRNYRDFLGIDDRFSHCHWLYQMAGGVLLPPWGKTEQWMLSVQHRPEDVARLLRNFERFAGALRS